jgi:enoyl-CoA hydratase/carnithine racemase
MLAMYHDYRVQNPSRGFLCLNEIYLGIPLQQPMVRIFREKVGLSTTLRSLVLEGKRFAGPEALNAQLVDALGGLEEAIGLVHERKLFDMARSPAYTGLKEGMFKDTLAALDDEPGNQAWQDFMEKIKESNAEEASNRVKQWELQGKQGKGAKI